MRVSHCRSRLMSSDLHSVLTMALTRTPLTGRDSPSWHCAASIIYSPLVHYYPIPSALSLG